MKLLPSFLIAAVILSAQMGSPVRFPVQLRQHLELTDAQLNTINQANLALNRYVAEKTRRTLQVQLEIAEETGRPALDANALGVRYLELEGIRREIAAEQRKTVEEIQRVFTTEQRTKLSALQQALTLYPTACEAIAVNVLAPPPFVGNAIPANRISPIRGGMIGGILPQFVRTAPCAGSAAGFLTGDFLPGPITTAPMQP